MIPLFMVFIDGLKPESVVHMPFLNSLETKIKIRTEFGYSPTCYASIFTGVYPNKHFHWFTWQYSPDTSPYQWLRKSRLDRLPHNIFAKYASYKITDFIARGVVPWQGVMTLQWWYIPVPTWHYFDAAVKKHWSEPGFIAGYPSVFDILRANDVPYEIVGLGKESAVVQYSFDKIKPLTYFFIGDIDGLSHHHGQDSSLVIDRLKKIDTMLQEKYRLLESKADDFCFVVFSDHGHVRMNDYIDLRSFFRSCGESLYDYIHFMDANFARFWFRNEEEEQRVRKVLSRLADKGFIMTEEHFQKYHVNMPDNRFGDLIFYLDVPSVFTMTPPMVQKTLKSRFVSLHGYSPDYPDCDAVFLSNRKARNCSQIELVDIMPSILDVFDIAIPNTIDGKTVWR